MSKISSRYSATKYFVICLVIYFTDIKSILLNLCYKGVIKEVRQSVSFLTSFEAGAVAKIASSLKFNRQIIILFSK